jgi:poly(3-hydroxybutyrate) depolymerase
LSKGRVPDSAVAVPHPKHCVIAAIRPILALLKPFTATFADTKRARNSRGDQQTIDPARVFITGLSSGGAMTSVMLATYPEVFAGGAIIAGLPYRNANTLMQAIYRMKGHGGPSKLRLYALVRAASNATDSWPTISVWHGGRDTTVDSSNADSIVRQWQKIHKVEGPPTRVERVDGFPRQVWCNAAGRAVIEEYIIDSMGHGAPIKAGGEEGLGKEDKYMLEVGISSTRHIAEFWGLTPVQGK